jgi:hypothetical protein
MTRAPAPFGAELLVSIPGSALPPRLPGSLFAWRDLRDAVLPPDLRLAVWLVMQTAALNRTQVRFLARPEIFTGGAPRAWLDARLGTVRDHLILSDGQTLRLLPGLDNHLFFYARGRVAAEAALNRLIGLAPEIFAGLASQVNRTLSLRIGARWVRPPTLLLRSDTNPPAEQGQQAPFFHLPDRPAEAAAASAAEALPEAEAPATDRPAHLVALSEAALGDAPFMAWLARVIQAGLLGTTPAMPLLLLPWLDRPTAELDGQVAAVLEALRATGTVFPRGESWAVRFATAPPKPAAMQGGRLTLHPTTPFWRLGTGLAEAAAVEVAGSGGLDAAARLFGPWCRRPVSIRRNLPGPTGGFDQAGPTT